MIGYIENVLISKTTLKGEGNRLGCYIRRAEVPFITSESLVNSMERKNAENQNFYECQE